MAQCSNCKQERESTTSAVVKGKYHRSICQPCLVGFTASISGNAASFERRRDFEDNADAAVQPYDANGPNPEFLRLYPDSAANVFKPEDIERMKRAF